MLLLKYIFPYATDEELEKLEEQYHQIVRELQEEIDDDHEDNN